MPAPNLYIRLTTGDIEPSDFTHDAHIRAAWECLQQPLADAITPFAAGLKALATRAGAPGRYHATITGAFLTLIAAGAQPGETFEAFRKRNPKIWLRACLSPYYSRHRLELAEAKRWFLMPDLNPLPACAISLTGVELATMA